MSRIMMQPLFYLAQAQYIDTNSDSGYGGSQRNLYEHDATYYNLSQ